MDSINRRQFFIRLGQGALGLLSLSLLSRLGSAQGLRPKPLPRVRPLPTAVAGQATLSLVLGRPTNTGITAGILSSRALEGFLEYGVAAGVYGKHSAQVTIPAQTPVEVQMEDLQPDTKYYYRFRSRRAGETDFASGAEHSFRTQRAPGNAFTFTIQGDSHPERPREHDPALYAQMLGAVAAEQADFHLTIGDDFSVDALPAVDADAVHAIYLRQRYFLGLVACSAPLFLTNGNHEQAALCNLDGTDSSVAVLAQNARNALFPQPATDGFYSGDTQTVPHIGLLRDYYAWTWGDALFVVIDPYWHSSQAVDNPFGGGEKTRDLWNSTLGDAQYQWLSRTLAGSTAKFKFVFTHHVLGTGRGGIEEAGLCEWGGLQKNGVDQFDVNRPNWPCPIHQLMVKTGVTIFFQGHDHIFVRQQLDGVVYQTLPECADPNYALYNAEAYRSGDKLPNSGYVRVNVSPEGVNVQYIRQYLPQDESLLHTSGEVAFSYTIKPKGV